MLFVMQSKQFSIVRLFSNESTDETALKPVGDFSDGHFEFT
jgi:hypothetical protein